MNKANIIINEIDNIYMYFRYSRAFFPYLNSEVAGNTNSQLFNINKNLRASINYTKPLTNEYIAFNNRVGHYLNQNSIIRLYALLDYHQIISDKVRIDKSLPGFDEVDILRRLRKLFSHKSAKYNYQQTEQKKLVDRIIKHFNIDISEPEDFPISIDTVITTLLIKTKEYIKVKLIY
jgi:hypothetical protein